MPRAERERREKLRSRAAGWFAEGVSHAKVARRSGVSPQALSTWRRRWADKGADALRSVGPPGAHRRVPDERFAEVATACARGPGRHDCDAAFSTTIAGRDSWRGTAQNGMARHGTTRHGPKRHDTARHGSEDISGG
ncbi:helix-turn-helix domain-containing protein [Embleya sp. NPDC050493]|uniref:helix-turn-helix domain-containing protein n=1 Tax=Embleya sp. NPDC050493 TaxID=3363989 RepID=UPI0037A8686B